MHRLTTPLLNPWRKSNTNLGGAGFFPVDKIFFADPGKAGVAALPWIARNATAFLKSIGGVSIFTTSPSFLVLQQSKTTN